MTSFRFRPRFKRVTALSTEAFTQRIRDELAKSEAPCVGVVIPEHIVLKVPVTERHFWSPQVSLSLEEREDGNTLIRGLYGPNPTVWLLFTFGYIVIGTMAFFALMLGFSKLSLGLDASILWLLPMFALASIGLYFVAQFGQKLGVEQTFMLHHFVEEILEERIVMN